MSENTLPGFFFRSTSCCFFSVSSTIKKITLRSMNITMTMMIIRTSHNHLYKNIFKKKNISPKYRNSSTSKNAKKKWLTHQLPSSQYQQQRLNDFWVSQTSVALPRNSGSPPKQGRPRGWLPASVQQLPATTRSMWFQPLL